MPRCGQYKVIRVDGTETVHIGNPTIRAIQLLIGCDTLDVVTIDRRKQTVMYVDDTGMIDGKPVSTKATVLYHRVCRPRTTHQIHRDMVTVPAAGLA